MYPVATRRLVALALGAALLLTTVALPSVLADARTQPPSPDGRRDPLVQADGPVDVTLAGVWDFGNGLVVQIKQSGTSITSSVLDYECSGANWRTFLTGTLDGETLEGTMTRCTPDDEAVVTEANCEQLWDTPFEAEVSRYEIVGTYVGQKIDLGGFTGEDHLPIGPGGTLPPEEDENVGDCEIIDEFDSSFYGGRIDCRPLTFEELAEAYPDHAHEVDLARDFETGEKLRWTDEQVANGFKARAEAFASDMARLGLYAPGTITSAYRPALYQAHFADLRDCALRLIHALADHPDLAEGIGDSVDAVKAEVDKHKLKSTVTTIAGQSVPVPYVCWREPLTDCKHVDGRAIDVTFRQVDGLDWSGNLRGWCRRWIVDDPVHWEEISGGRCGVGPGRADIDIYVESPVAVMVTDSTGRRIGYNPETASNVNDFGAGAFYSGPESEPQRLFAPAAVAAGDEVEVTLTPTGDGPYRVRLAFYADDGFDVSEVVMEGVAELGQPIAPVRHAFTPSSDVPTFPEAEPIAPETGWDQSFEARTVRDAPAVVSLNPPVAAAVLVNEELGAVGIRLAEGAQGQVAVRVPNAVVEPPVRVLVDGQEVPSSVEPGERNTIARFAAPAGAVIVEIGGNESPTAAGGWPPTALMVIILVAITAAAGALLLWRRRGRRPTP